MMTDTGVPPAGSGSRASHEAASASSPEASIPNADYVTKLESALLFYAQEWEDAKHPFGLAGPSKTITHKLACDYGQRARDALGVSKCPWEYTRAEITQIKQSMRETNDRARVIAEERSELWALQRIIAIATRRASAIEARSDATPKSDAAEGESAVPNGETPK
jgi:hypothetical protein